MRSLAAAAHRIFGFAAGDFDPSVKDALRRRPFIFGLCVLGFLAVLAVWIGVIYELASERRRALENVERYASNMARVFEEHTERTIKGVDQLLLLLKSQYERNPQSFVLSDALEGPFLREMAIQVGIIGTDGFVRSTSLGAVTTPVDLRDREHFWIHRDRDSGALFINKPVLGRQTNRWSIPIARRLNGHGGSLMLESRVGAGTTVTVRFPPARTLASQPAPLAAVAAGE